MLDLYAKSGYKMKLHKRICWWFRRMKYTWQRARWGFSEYDICDLDAYFSALIAGALKYWSHHTHSFPYEMTDTQWRYTLRQIAECFEFWNKDLPTPAYDAYHKAVKRIVNKDGGVTIEVPDELLQAWRAEEKANYELKRDKLKEGFDLLYKFYPNLWD